MAKKNARHDNRRKREKESLYESRGRRAITGTTIGILILLLLAWVATYYIPFPKF